MLSRPVEARQPCSLDISRRVEIEASPKERRKRLRLRVAWPLSFFRSDDPEPVHTVTQDLSSDGFYCIANTVFMPGTIMTCTLGVPTIYPYGPGAQTRPVLCRVRVIRVEALGDSGPYGVGCRIEDYRFAGSAPPVGP